MNNEKKVFKLLLIGEGWGNLDLTISNMEIIEEGENNQIGTLNYDLGGYTPEDLEAINKTEEELIVYCNDLILEILEKGLDACEKKIENEVMEKLRNNI